MMKINDKLAHYLVNLAISMVGFLSVPLAVGLSIGASLGKEYGDSKATGNHWCWYDILADLGGLATGLLLILIVKG